MHDPNEDKFSVEEFNRDMNKIQEGKYVNLSRIGLPKPGFIDAEGVMFFLMIPVFFLWLLVMDPIHGWVRWRKMGMVLVILVSAVVFALMVFVGVQHEMGGVFGLAEDSTAFKLMENILTGGFAGMLFLLWPRTIILVIAIFAVISLINYLI